MESVILSGPSDVKIRRKYQLPPSYHDTSGNLNDPFLPPDPLSLQEDPDDVSDPYFVWRRNSPFVYDSVSVYNLDWPSLVVDFMEDSTNFRVKNGSITQRLLLGTHTSGSETEFAMVAELRSPVYSLRENMTNCENFNGFLAARKRENNPLQPNSPNLDLKAKIVHPGEVNRISHVPGTPFSFVTQSNNGTLYLFDYSKHPSNPRDTKLSHPQLVLSHGHSCEGYGIAWNSSNKLASCASDGSLCLWDLNSKSQTSTKDFPGVKDSVPLITPLSTYSKNPNFLPPNLNPKKEQVKPESDPNTSPEDGSTADGKLDQSQNNSKGPNEAPNSGKPLTQAHSNNTQSLDGAQGTTEGLNDLEFLHTDDNTLVACCDDGSVYLVDFRTSPSHGATSSSASSLFNHRVASLDSEVNCLSVNRFSSNYFVCGCVNGHIYLFDLRVPCKSVLLLKQHKDSVTQVEFNRSSSGLFASSSGDSTVCIFDLACRGSELRFVHQGHKAQVNDVSWAKLNYYQTAHAGFTLASVAQDNLLQCFTPNYFSM